MVKKIVAAVKKHKLQNDVEYIAFRQHVCDEILKYAPKGTKVAYLNGSLTPEYCKGPRLYGYRLQPRHNEEASRMDQAVP